MAVSATSSDRNYLDILNGTASTGKTYNAVFGDKEQNLSNSDFLQLMVNQLTNQDFMNPIDDSQYLSQMAQFSTMEEMMQLCQYSKQNYVMAMLGKEVTVSNNTIGGETKSVTGKVEKVVLEKDDYKIYIDGKPYDYSKVTVVSDGSQKSSGSTNVGDDNADEA